MEELQEKRKLEEEQKIKDAILTEDIQNEILLPNKQTELRGEQKQKQWEKCKEGLARHRAIKKKQTEEEKMKREQEKLQMKQRIREEMMREKLKQEVEKELEEKPQKAEPTPIAPTKTTTPTVTPPKVELQIEDLEDYLKWKREMKRKKEKPKQKEEEEEEEEGEEEDDFIPSVGRDVESEEDEEATSRQRYKRSRILPPRAKLERTVSRPMPRTSSILSNPSALYNSQPPGRFFYI